MSDAVDFSYLVNLAMQQNDHSHMRPVIEKELLHYDILYALDQAQLLDQLTFQGGTALRLCYGLERFSEDLDFCGGRGFKKAQLVAMKECLESYLGKRYGLEVTVKEPKEMKEDPKYAAINVDKWQIAVTTAPDRKDIPKQKIKVEVANVDAYTRQPKALLKNYNFLPDGYEDTLIMTESLNEIMADKIVSFVNTEKYVRYRDIWDLVWLIRQGAEFNKELVHKKIEDYKILGYLDKLNEKELVLEDLVMGKTFMSEMSRFIPMNVQERTLKKDKYRHYLVHELKQLLGLVGSSL